MGKRPVALSITHKFCADRDPEVDISQTHPAAPDDFIAWW